MPVPLSQFRREVAVEAHTAPTPLIDHEIRNTIIDWCDYTRTWRLDVTADAVRLELDGTEYEYVLPAETRVVTLNYVPPGGGTSIDPAWGCVATWLYVDDATKVRVSLLPETARTEGLIFRMAFKPTRDAQSIHKKIYEDNLEAIGHGAKARLLAMPNKAWSDPRAAAFHLAEFERAKKKEKAEVLNGYTRHSTLRITPRNYYG